MYSFLYHHVNGVNAPYSWIMMSVLSGVPAVDFRNPPQQGEAELGSSPNWVKGLGFRGLVGAGRP